jgi:hypothetical protein
MTQDTAPVVDALILPTVVWGHTNAAAVKIEEKDSI